MSDRGKNANLIDSIVNLSIWQVNKFDFFESINCLVDQSFDLIDTWVRTFS